MICLEKAGAEGKTAAVPAGILKMRIPPVQMTIQKKTEAVLMIIPEPEMKIIRKREKEPEAKISRKVEKESETKKTRKRGTEPKTTQKRRTEPKTIRKREKEPGMEMIQETGTMITQMQTEMALVMV